MGSVTHHQSVRSRLRLGSSENLQRVDHELGREADLNIGVPLGPTRSSWTCILTTLARTRSTRTDLRPIRPPSDERAVVRVSSSTDRFAAQAPHGRQGAREPAQRDQLDLGRSGEKAACFSLAHSPALVVVGERQHPRHHRRPPGGLPLHLRYRWLLGEGDADATSPEQGPLDDVPVDGALCHHEMQGRAG